MSILNAVLSKTTEPERLNTTTSELADANYPWHVEQRHDGWPQAGYEWKSVDVKVRHITGEFGAKAEVQFEIGTDELKGKRLFGHSSSFHVSLALAKKLARVLAPEVFEALEAYHAAVDGGIESDPEPWAKAERLYALAKKEG